MPDTWTVNTGDRTYGPYTITQLQAFASEGRLAPHSLVARTGEQTFRSASEDPDLMSLFRAGRSAAAVAQALRNDQPQRSFGRKDSDEPGELSHYIIMADMKSRSVAGIEEEVFNLGPAFAVLPQVWLLACDLSINAVRNALVQKLGKLDMLFVVDATRDRAAWFNFGPEADTRIRRLWARSSEARKTAQAS
ncbi:MAG TPA: DUF4339 domain-containing protein [Rhizomicrobium sp.]